MSFVLLGHASVQTTSILEAALVGLGHTLGEVTAKIAEIKLMLGRDGGTGAQIPRYADFFAWKSAANAACLDSAKATRPALD